MGSKNGIIQNFKAGVKQRSSRAVLLRIFEDFLEVGFEIASGKALPIIIPVFVSRFQHFISATPIIRGGNKLFIDMKIQKSKN